MIQKLMPHANKLKFLLNEHSSTLLTVAGVGGTVASAVLTGRASFKAAEIIAQEKKDAEIELQIGDTDLAIPAATLSKTEKVKLTWQLFLLPVGVSAGTIVCIVMANRISSKRIAALTVAAGVTERAFQEYKEKVVEKLNPRQEEKIRDEIAQDRVNANPPKEVMIAGTGDVLFMDALTGRYFQSTMEDVKRAENKVNYELIHFNSCPLSFFYDEIGLLPTDYTDTVGWQMGNHVEVKISTTLTPDNRPCAVINFSRMPVPDYNKTWD